MLQGGTKTDQRNDFVPPCKIGTNRHLDTKTDLIMEQIHSNSCPSPFVAVLRTGQIITKCYFPLAPLNLPLSRI